MSNETLHSLSHDAALDLLSRARVCHYASTDEGGAPLLRTVHPCVSDGWLLFHCGPRGEKTASFGREAVFAVEEVVAAIPSYFIDPKRACPATTYYESVHVSGELEIVDDARLKTRALAVLLSQMQPEGGHAPMRVADPSYDKLYRKAVAGLVVAGIDLSRATVTGKTKLGQNLSPTRRAAVLEGLWRRGAPGNLAAIERVRAANPRQPAPMFARPPARADGVTLHVALDAERDLDDAITLLARQYWNVERFDGADLRRVHERADAWIGARDATGRLVATARAATDHRKHAYIGDVVVAPDMRGRGLGDALMRLLLDHPALRDVFAVRLATRDAQRFYAKFGFVPAEALALTPQLVKLHASTRAAGPAVSRDASGDSYQENRKPSVSP